jgi:hypothetical protein
LDGKQGAVLVHDPAVLERAALLDSVRTFVRLAAVNTRLRGDVLDQLTELRRSRLRLLTATDAERAALEARLNAGALRRGIALGPVIDRLGVGQANLARGLADLRALARGLHPRAIDEGGLFNALTVLADEASIPVDLQVGNLSPNLPDPVVLTAYFACAEGLANAAKHSRAEHARVAVAQQPDQLVVEIHDDGIGSATLAGGLGLRGVADRVEVLDGVFALTSNPNDGTTIRVELPLRTPQVRLTPGTPVAAAS